MSTFTAFVESVANLSVTGVRRRHLSPPAQINSADLPLSFPRVPSQTFVRRTFEGADYTGLVELVVVVSPDTLNLKPNVFAEAVALVDNLNSAFGALPVIDTWSVRLGAESFDGGATAYTVLVATVEGSW